MRDCFLLYVFSIFKNWNGEHSRYVKTKLMFVAAFWTCIRPRLWTSTSDPKRVGKPFISMASSFKFRWKNLFYSYKQWFLCFSSDKNFDDEDSVDGNRPSSASSTSSKAPSSSRRNVGMGTTRRLGSSTLGSKSSGKTKPCVVLWSQLSKLLKLDVHGTCLCVLQKWSNPVCSMFLLAVL